MATPTPISAEDIARDRLEQYLDKETAGLLGPLAWEFYTSLLKQAREHKANPDSLLRICRLPAYKADEAAANENFENLKKNRFPQSDNSPRGEQT